MQPFLFGVYIRHTCVSKCSSDFDFGEEDNIDKKRPKINNPLTIAPTNIWSYPPSVHVGCNRKAAVSKNAKRTG